MKHFLFQQVIHKVFIARHIQFEILPMEHNSEIKANDILRIQVILTERGKIEEISK